MASGLEASQFSGTVVYRDIGIRAASIAADQPTVEEWVRLRRSLFES